MIGDISKNEYRASTYRPGSVDSLPSWLFGNPDSEVQLHV